MIVKPFSEILKDEKILESTEVIKPFIDRAVGGKEIDNSTQEREELLVKENFSKKIINTLGSVQGFFTLLAIFIFVAISVDTIQTITALYESSSLLDAIYLIALVTLGTALVMLTYKNYLQIRTLKNAKKSQVFFTLQKKDPTKEIILATLKLLKHYSLHDDKILQEKIQLLQSRISSSHDYKEIYKDLDEEVLQVIDTQVQNKIKAASTQAALSTAISPLALLDAGIIIWRSVLLTKEIALLYGYKAGWLSTLVLLKRGAFNVFFAGSAELASEYINNMAELTLISKISISATQGLTNAILLARLGFGVMEACRPLPMRVKRGSFIKGVYLSIKNLILNPKER